nr:hypothetical protein [uncultured Desulfuromonas sp.]
MANWINGLRDLFSKWKLVVSEQTATDPLRHPSTADIETFYRQLKAGVSLMAFRGETFFHAAFRENISLKTTTMPEQTQGILLHENRQTDT